MSNVEKGQNPEHEVYSVMVVEGGKTKWVDPNNPKEEVGAISVVDYDARRNLSVSAKVFTR